VFAEEGGADGAAKSGDYDENEGCHDNTDDEHDGESDGSRYPVAERAKHLLGVCVGCGGQGLLYLFVETLVVFGADLREETRDSAKHADGDSGKKAGGGADAEAIRSGYVCARNAMFVERDGDAAGREYPKRDENANGNDGSEAADDASDDGDTTGGFPVHADRSLHHGMLPMGAGFNGDGFGGRLHLAGSSGRERRRRWIVSVAGAGDADLRGVALRTERCAVFDACSAFGTVVLHRLKLTGGERLVQDSSGESRGRARNYLRNQTAPPFRYARRMGHEALDSTGYALFTTLN